MLRRPTTYTPLKPTNTTAAHEAHECARSVFVGPGVRRKGGRRVKKFARRMPGDTDANVACELSADAHTIKPHHLPIGSAPCAGKGDGTPTITNGGISIAMPDLAIGIHPTDHNPFGTPQRIRDRR